VYRDPTVTVLLRDYLGPGDVVDMLEGEAGAVRGLAVLVHGTERRSTRWNVFL
jgi:hypothetical protein